MNRQTLTQFHWFWAWDDEKEEAWLRRQSQAGRHLESVGFPGFYTFRLGEPQDYVYRLDFNPDQKDYAHYLQLFRDAGWEHLAVYGNWQYFRILAKPGENPEIYTDNSSKIKKYQRVMLIPVVFLPVYLMLLNRRSTYPGLFFEAITFLGFLLLLLYLFAMLMLLRRMGQLRRGPQ